MKCFRSISFFALLTLGISILFAPACFGYDIVRVTDTPGISEDNVSIANFGDTFYAAWVANGDLYFDKSIDLGRTWGAYRKIIEGPCTGSAKIVIATTGRIFVSCLVSGHTVLKASDDDAQTFYDIQMPQELQGSDNLRFAINRSGSVIYVRERNWLRAKSFDGGETFSVLAHAMVVASYKPYCYDVETFEISEDGRHVYVLVTCHCLYRSGLLYTKSSDYGDTFTELEPFSSSGSFLPLYYSNTLNVTTDNSGKLYVQWIYAWLDHTVGPRIIYLKRSNDFGESFLLSRVSDFYDYYGPPREGQPVCSSISVDASGNVYSAFYKLANEDDDWVYELFFDRSPGPGEFLSSYYDYVPDERITGLIDTSSSKPHIAVTSDGETALIMWTNPDMAGGTHDLYSASFHPTPQHWIPGDCNFDGRVNREDLAILSSHYGTQNNAAVFDGDLDNNEAVGLSDLMALKRNFGKSLLDADRPIKIYDEHDRLLFVLHADGYRYFFVFPDLERPDILFTQAEIEASGILSGFDQVHAVSQATPPALDAPAALVTNDGKKTRKTRTGSIKRLKKAQSPNKPLSRRRRR